ncbi:MAG TPA: hypothetical protein VGA37_16435 [Gemmatimonadales bacterium]
MRWAPHAHEERESLDFVSAEVRRGLLAVGCWMRSAESGRIGQEMQVVAECGEDDRLRVTITPRRGTEGATTLTYMVQIDAHSYGADVRGRMRAVEPSERARSRADALYRWLRSPDRVRE